MSLNDLSLSPKQRNALREIKEKASNQFPINKTIVYGSVAREEAEPESDLDVLILTEYSFSHKEKHEIYAIVTEINLKYETNLSVLIVEEEKWENGICSVLPIKDDVKKQGIRF